MSILAAERVHAADLDARIMYLERAISAVRAQRALVQIHLDSYKYPVLTLPNEIVAEIFVHYLPVYPECPPFTGSGSPTHLTQICRKWREVALATPTLWRATFFSRPPQLDVFDMWLSRSGRCPISLEAGPSKSLPQFSSAQCARWEHLCLRSPILIEGPMPLLRQLRLTFSRTYPNAVVFPDVPLLHSVLLNRYAARSVTLPWLQLTSVVLDDLFPFQCAPVLQETSNLIHCTLTLLCAAFRDCSVITLPRLESLTLDACDGTPGSTGMIGFVETFIVPALHDLHIFEGFLEDPVNSLTTVISKSGCKLQKISILGDRRISKDAYRQAFPAIQFSFDGLYLGGEGPDEAGSPDVEALQLG